jgi:hypothetical protein
MGGSCIGYGTLPGGGPAYGFGSGTGAAGHTGAAGAGSSCSTGAAERGAPGVLCAEDPEESDDPDEPDEPDEFGGLRGANQSLTMDFSVPPPSGPTVPSSASLAAPTASVAPGGGQGAGAGPERAPGGAASTGAPVPCAFAEPSLPPETASPETALRTTTGGIGREPGMLIRIRVVSVVSVLCSFERRSAAPASPAAPACSAGPSPPLRGSPCGCSDGYWRVPYGGVPDGYAAPPRPWGPEDELSVSRLKAGSPG